MQQIGNPIRVYEIHNSVASMLGANSKILFANSAKYLGQTKEVFIKNNVHVQAKNRRQGQPKAYTKGSKNCKGGYLTIHR